MNDVLEESLCTCRNGGNPMVIDSYYPPHAPWCNVWCTCRLPGVPIIDNLHKADCGIYEGQETT